MANAPYAHGVVSVGTSATLICSPGANGVLIQNNGSVAVVLGGSDVTATGATAGVSVAANATVTVPAFGDSPHDLYGITGSSTANVAYLFPA